MLHILTIAVRQIIHAFASAIKNSQLLMFSKDYLSKKELIWFRSSHQRYSIKLKNFAKFTGKHLYQSLFFNKVEDLSPATLLKQRLWHRCFPVNFRKFLRTPFLQNTSGRLLLLVTILSFLHFAFWKKNLWTLFVFHN